MKIRRKKNVKKGIQFCVMVCGASGTGTYLISFTPESVLSELFADRQLYLGRTTFVNTLCGKQVLEGKDADDPEHAHEEEGVRIKPVTVGKSNRLNFPPRRPIIHMLTIPVSQSSSWMRREPASP